MIQATSRPLRTTPQCARCGMDLDKPRPGSDRCGACVMADRVLAPKTVRQARAVAKAQGWNFDDPCAGPWGRDA